MGAAINMEIYENKNGHRLPVFSVINKGSGLHCVQILRFSAFSLFKQLDPDLCCETG